jgi:hypothetical protein
MSRLTRIKILARIPNLYEKEEASKIGKKRRMFLEPTFPEFMVICFTERVAMLILGF